MKPYIVGITGASGVVYGIRFVQVLAELGYEIALVISKAGWLVIQEELRIPNKTSLRASQGNNGGRSNPGFEIASSPAAPRNDEAKGVLLGALNPLKECLEPFFESKLLERISLYSNDDFTAPIASGSYPTQGMVIIPCSTGTLGCMANGVSQHLIHRAAECTLKERRCLVVVPRETPMSVIQLENLLKLARAGVRVLPASPAFYSGARTIQDLVDFVVGKVLDALEIPHAVYPRWTGKTVGVRASDED